MRFIFFVCQNGTKNLNVMICKFKKLNNMNSIFCRLEKGFKILIEFFASLKKLKNDEFDLLQAKKAQRT